MSVLCTRDPAVLVEEFPACRISVLDGQISDNEQRVSSIRVCVETVKPPYEAADSVMMKGGSSGSERLLFWHGSANVARSSVFHPSPEHPGTPGAAKTLQGG